MQCHYGISAITDGKMMDKIRMLGKQHGDPEGCIVCHGGNPGAVLKEKAHQGVPAAMKAADGPQRFYPNPGNQFVAQYTCGQCHHGYAERVQKSIKSTEVEKIQSSLCLPALKRKGEGNLQALPEHGKYQIEDADGFTPSAGSEIYQSMMKSITAESALFTARLSEISPLDYSTNQKQANKQCSACHHREQQQVMEDAHGTGCSACHLPYRSGSGYLGDDPTIDKSADGKLLVHRLQGTENTMVSLPAIAGEEKPYSGIHPDNCFTCHYDVRKEMLNPIGSVMTHYGQRHHAGIGGNLLCQDCHTTIDMHGDGNIALSAHGQMEVTCEDCHGTVSKAPWELPLAALDKWASKTSETPRGLAKEALDIPGARYPAKDGYLLTSRGNPFGNIVKSGNSVILYSAAGFSVEVPILKWIKKNQAWKSEFSRQAMFEVSAHQEKMTCNGCHGDVAQPCVGCHASASAKHAEIRIEY